MNFECVRGAEATVDSVHMCLVKGEHTSRSYLHEHRATYTQTYIYTDRHTHDIHMNIHMNACVYKYTHIDVGVMRSDDRLDYWM